MAKRMKTRWFADGSWAVEYDWNVLYFSKWRPYNSLEYEVNAMTNQKPIQLLSIASDEASRKAIQEYLTKASGIDVAGETSSSSDALKQLQNNDIDIALLDLGVADVDGICLIKEIRKSHPLVRIIIVTASDSPEDIFASMDAGADAYVLKGNLFSVLEKAIRSARLGAIWLDPGIAQQVLQVMQTAPVTSNSRVLPTGYMPIPLTSEDKSLLHDVAEGNCEGGVCLVDPSFLKKLKRFSPAAS